MLGNARLCRPSLKLLKRPNIERIHESATAILEKTGLNVHHPVMRRKLGEAGATLGEGARTHIPARMVEKALKTAKHEVVLYNRLGKPVMPMGPHQIYFGTGSDLLYTRDGKSERRAATVEDVGQAARVCDALEDIDFVMSFALPKEAPERDIEPLQYYEQVRNTVKPVIMTSFSGLEPLERMHQMACALVGGDKAFRQRPNYIMYGQFVSPLQHDRMAIERLIFCADREVPLIYIPTIMPGVSGPLTLAGSLALATAESLAGLVMQQVQRPGAPFIFGACVSQLDMRTMQFPYGSPEWRLNDLVMGELARYYGLPVFGTAGATDSKTLDAQAGAEYLGSLLVAAMAGTNLIHDVGYMDSGRMGSLESLVLGADQIRWVKKFIGGFELNDESLALAAIGEVGPGRQFLDHEHTLKHLRQVVWEPYASLRTGYDSWAAAGSKDYEKRAREYAQDLVHSHKPAPLDSCIEAKLRALCNQPG
jgi:trimethylamine--corrinoid protein Co-methyltransferase